MNRSSPHTLLGRFSCSGRVFVGAVQKDRVIEMDSPHMADAIAGAIRPTGREHILAELKVLPPVERPSKIICVGLNFRSHIREMGWETPEAPVIFSKPPSAIVGPEEDIVIPKVSSRVDYEGECAVVVGKRARHATDGAEHIFGFTCLNDVTARDLQEADVDWTRAKGFDTFAPMGPFVSSCPPTRVVTRLNGRVVQDSPLSDRVFDDSDLVEYISGIMTLEPGDIIATGTPSGIGPLRCGDTVEIELDGVGVLRNQVVKAP